MFVDVERECLLTSETQVPVILVGNKIDLRGVVSITNEDLEDEILPIMNEFKVSLPLPRKRFTLPTPV